MSPTTAEMPFTRPSVALLFLKNERDEHLAMSHIFHVFSPKKADVFALLHASRGNQEKRAEQRQPSIRPGW